MAERYEHLRKPQPTEEDWLNHYADYICEVQQTLRLAYKQSEEASSYLSVTTLHTETILRAVRNALAQLEALEAAKPQRPKYITDSRTQEASDVDNKHK